MARTRKRLYSRLSFKPLMVGGKRDPKKRFIVVRGKDKGTAENPKIISYAEMIARTQGAHPSKLAAERKAGFRVYKSAASEQQAKTQIDTRRKRREQFELDQYHRVPSNPIPYQNTDGEIAYDYSAGKYLMIMHLYRDAYEHALYTGDASGLRKFKHKIIITYSGPSLPNYHNKGVRVYPETNLKKILAAV
jgi:hypothetical protein